MKVKKPGNKGFCLPNTPATHAFYELVWTIGQEQQATREAALLARLPAIDLAPALKRSR